MGQLPPVTCLCLTHTCPNRDCRHKDGTVYARREWLAKAIRYFQAQSYAERELLILADGADVRDLVPDDPHIRLIPTDGRLPIGEKRNFGASRARGEIIAHWDDDDWSAPGRIADQVERLEQSGKAVTGYTKMLFTNGRGWWRYNGSAALGTSLCYRKEWWSGHPFPAIQSGEDNKFYEAAHKLQQLTDVPAELMMVASIHPGNTSKRSLAGGSYTRLPKFAGVPGCDL